MLVGELTPSLPTPSSSTFSIGYLAYLVYSQLFALSQIASLKSALSQIASLKSSLSQIV
jgi:hypothetical protein